MSKQKSVQIREGRKPVNKGEANTEMQHEIAEVMLVVQVCPTGVPEERRAKEYTQMSLALTNAAAGLSLPLTALLVQVGSLLPRYFVVYYSKIITGSGVGFRVYNSENFMMGNQRSRSESIGMFSGSCWSFKCSASRFALACSPNSCEFCS
jgi:hypothetical protein